MVRLTFRIAILVSMVLFVVTALLIVASYFFSPWEHYYASFTERAHVGVWGRNFDPRIVFFNDPDGPYSGSIIGFVDSEGNVHPPLIREEGFGDSWGIYYRYFQWADAKLWTLMVSLWYPLAVFAIPPATRCIVRSVRRRRTVLTHDAPTCRSPEEEKDGAGA